MLLKSDLDVQETHLLGQFAKQMLKLNHTFRYGQIHICQRYYFGHTVVYFMSDLKIQEPLPPPIWGRSVEKSSSLVAALGVTKLITIKFMTLVTLHCAT